MVSKRQQQFINALKIKKYRYKYSRFIVEGVKSVQDFLDCGYRARMLFSREPEKDAFTSRTGMIDDFQIVTEKEMSSLTSFQQPSPVLAVFDMPDPASMKFKNDRWYLGLDGIQDPGNLGSIIRTADWFGIDAVLCSPGTADAYNPKTVQASMGSLARVTVLYGDIAETIRNNKLLGYAAVLDGDDYRKSLKEAGIILIGNEGQGLSDELLACTGFRISIPGRGGAESLNAAAAAAVLCSAIPG